MKNRNLTTKKKVPINVYDNYNPLKCEAKCVQILRRHLLPKPSGNPVGRAKLVWIWGNGG
jgi:hypothetical protein